MSVTAQKRASSITRCRRHGISVGRDHKCQRMCNIADRKRVGAHTHPRRPVGSRTRQVDARVDGEADGVVVSGGHVDRLKGHELLHRCPIQSPSGRCHKQEHWLSACHVPCVADLHLHVKSRDRAGACHKPGG
jgi:hypothetical protein